jgi:tetratricopeptide (TPR) repeat protein
LNDTVVTLGSVLRAQGKVAEADALAREVRADEERRRAEALTAAREAVRRQPNDPELHRSVGHLLKSQGKLDEAEAAYVEALRLRPEMAEAWAGLGECRRISGDFAAATEHYSKAIELKPGVAEYRYQRACLYLRTGMADKAQADLVELIRCVEGDAGAQNGYAWQLATHPDPRLREPKAAIAMAEKAVARRPHDGGIWNTLGAALYRDGRWTDAVAALEKSIELRNGGNSFDFLFMAMALEGAGDSKAAGHWFDKAVLEMQALQSANHELIRFRAEANAVLGRPATQP